MANTKVQSEQIEDGSITADKLADGTIVAAELADNAVETAAINADAVTGAKIADNAIDSEHYTDGSIDTAHIADSQITVGKMAANSVDSDQYVDGSIDTVHIADLQVTTAKIANGNISTAKIADNAVTSAKIDTNIDIAGTFDVTGATTLDSTLAVAGDANFDSGTLFVDVSANKVGIGDTTPAARFTIKAADNTYAGGLRIEGTDETTALGITHVNGDNFFSGNATDDHLVLKSDGKVGIGTTSPDSPLEISSADDTRLKITDTGDSSELIFRSDGANTQIYTNTAHDLGIYTTGNAGQLFLKQSNGNVGIGTTNPNVLLHLEGTDGVPQIRLQRASTTIGGIIRQSSDPYGLMYDAFDGNTAAPTHVFRTSTDGTNFTEGMRITTTGQINATGGAVSTPTYSFIGDTNTGMSRPTSDTINFVTGGSEKMRVGSSEIQFFKTDGSVSSVGVFIQSNGRYIGTTNTNLEPMILNRQHSDGDLIEFRHANSVEGSISVSGSTVSYNGFSGRHETSGIANNIAVGTVVSTIDALDTHSDTGEDREDHAKVKVSDTVGDSRVYGVLAEYSDKTNKPMVASVGIGSVKVTGACSGGDLLESNGDGTAKVQSDDIVRSKTIGKVTIGNSETGVKLVSCVLYCG